MRMHAVHGLAAALLLFTGCATTDAPASRPAPVAAKSGTAKRAPRVVCEEEADTGSHISRRRCRVVEQLDRASEATQVELTRPRPTPPAAGN